MCVKHVYCIYIPEFAAWAMERALSVDGGVGGGSLAGGAGRPVVVVSGGVVIARQRVQALRQIMHGDSADRVARMCPDAVVRVRDVHVERAGWEALLRALHGVTPFIHAVQPPFVFATDVEKEVLGPWAARWRVQVGAARQRTIAQFAAIRSAVGHVVHVEHGREQAFLDRFEVRRLADLGTPPDMMEQMELFGYRTLGTLRRLTARQMAAQFGPDGEYIHAMIHPGADARIPPWVPPPSVTAEHVWTCPAPAAERLLRAVLEKLVARAVAELGDRRSQYVRLEMEPTGVAGVLERGRMLQAPCHSARAFMGLAWTLVEQMVSRHLELDRMTLHLEALRMPAVHQEDLFDQRPVVDGAIRTIHRRYPGAIRKAELRPHAVFDEDRIELGPVGVPDGESGPVDTPDFGRGRR